MANNRLRKIKTSLIQSAVAELVADVAFKLRPDVKKALEAAAKREKEPRAREALRIILQNARLAERRRIPLCQDTGMTVVFCEVGRRAVIDGNIDAAINKGVADATKKAYLRHSIVADPVERKNTGTNTPVIIHYSWRSDAKIKISVLLKGFGCENKGQTVMLNPTVSVDDIEAEVVRIIKEAGPDACPPYIIGIGLGGTMDKAAELAKKALLEPIGKSNTQAPWCAAFERRIIKKAGQLGIGALGLGGRATVLDAKLNTFPTHIAGMPLAVNISCHSLRRGSVVV